MTSVAILAGDRLKPYMTSVTILTGDRLRPYMVSWSFYGLEQKLIYKARQNQSAVIKVDPRYTIQCCPVYGHIEKANRNKKTLLFTCKNCGLTFRSQVVDRKETVLSL